MIQIEIRLEIEIERNNGTSRKKGHLADTLLLAISAINMIKRFNFVQDLLKKIPFLLCKLN